MLGRGRTLWEDTASGKKPWPSAQRSLPAAEPKGRACGQRTLTPGRDHKGKRSKASLALEDEALGFHNKSFTQFCVGMGEW